MFQKHMSRNCPHKNNDAKKNAWRMKLKELVNAEKNINNKASANTSETKKVEELPLSSFIASSAYSVCLRCVVVRYVGLQYSLGCSLCCRYHSLE